MQTTRAESRKYCCVLTIYFLQEYTFTQTPAELPCADGCSGIRTVQRWPPALSYPTSKTVDFVIPRPVVIPPFLAVVRSRHQAAMASFCFGVMPPSAVFGRS